MRGDGIWLGDLSWPEVAEGDPLLLAIPLGSTEQHGPHLPLDTDTKIGIALAERLALQRSDVMVAPALPYGSSGEHAGFPGTLSIGGAALEHVIVELGRSAMPTFSGLILIVWHGGNHEAVTRAMGKLNNEGRRTIAWFPRISGGDAHAGRVETSLMLAIAPDDVRIDVAEAGNTAPLSELMTSLRANGVRACSPTGVLGDPNGASAEEGEELLRLLVNDLCHFVENALPVRQSNGEPR